MNAKRLTTNAILIALYVVLSFVALNFGFLKLSFALLPIFISALYFGAADAVIVAAIASFAQQMLSYGFTATTLLWMLPPVAMGLLVGLYARARHFQLTKRQTALITLLGCLLVTTINSVVMVIDGRVYGYPVAFTFSVLALRYVSSLVMAAVYTLVVPRVLALLARSGMVGGK